MTDILDTLKNLYNARGEEIEAWMAASRKEAEPFLTTSVDLRHSGARLAPVDTNLYPAGFHHLSPQATARAGRFLKRFLEEHFPGAKRLLIIPENHTRNLAYLENLSAILSICAAIGVDARLGSLLAKDAPLELDTASGKRLTQYPLVRIGDKLALADGFSPDVILMNNDMTSGPPEILQGLAQPVLPPVSMGWYRRRKSVHFDQYKKLSEAFGKQFEIDPWLLAADFYSCGFVDFKEHMGLERVAHGIEQVLARAREKHKEYGIKEEPYVFVKADSGTYGMGIMVVRSAAEILDLNKKNRNKMNVVKEGARVSEVIIQEGIMTADTVQGKPAEPMIYMIDGVPIGGMFRVNGERDAYGNLNASGMEFTGMCDEAEDECGQWKSVQDCYFRSYGIVAALAALAAPRENYESYMLNL